MAEFVCDDVQEAMFVIYHFLGQLDGSVMFVDDRDCAVGVLGLSSLALPVRSAGSGVECLAPDQADTACRFGEVAYLTAGDCAVDFCEEVFGGTMLTGFPVFLCLDFCFGAFRRALSFARR